MDTKKFVMVTMSLIVGVILITGVITPIISSVQSTGGGSDVPATTLADITAEKDSLVAEGVTEQTVLFEATWPSGSYDYEESTWTDADSFTFVYENGDVTTVVNGGAMTEATYSGIDLSQFTSFEFTYESGKGNLTFTLDGEDSINSMVGIEVTSLERFGEMLIEDGEIIANSGSGESNDLGVISTLLSVIPLILTVGLVIGAVSFLRMKQ